MTTTINAQSGVGIAISGDGSGIMKVQSNGVTTNALAWVNFNGTGTVAIRSAYNVSSITDNGTGDYTVNFTNALSDANYAAVFGGTNASSGTGRDQNLGVKNNTAPTTTALRIQAFEPNTGAVDVLYANVAIFGN